MAETPAGRWADMPLSAPLWLWIAYGLLTVMLAAGAFLGGLIGVFCAVAASAFSFQFWTVAAFRGLERSHPSGPDV